MAAAGLRQGASSLMGAASLLATTTASGAARSRDVARAAEMMTGGSSAVRSLGGPFFARMADDIAAQSRAVAGGASPGPAIASAMDGASWLLRAAAARVR